MPAADQTKRHGTATMFSRAGLDRLDRDGDRKLKDDAFLELDYRCCCGADFRQRLVLAESAGE
jgi:hypothetical protein